MTETYNPFVYWAQTENKITLKVDLAKVKDIKINLQERNLQINAYGQGARGCNNYVCDIDLHELIDPDGSNYKVFDRQIDLTLKKKSYGWWPRLTSKPQKPPWIKIDFDKWKSEDMDDNEYENRDVNTDYPNTYDQLHKEEFGYRKEDFKKVYLIIYNLCQFVGYLYILVVMGVKYFRDGSASMKHTYDIVGNPMKFVQSLQFLEVIHPLLGYTKTNIMLSLMQVGSRSFVLFFLIEGEKRMQTKSIVFYLFIVWSVVELIRYLYYITQLLNVEIYFLTWLRYTIWIPLFPLVVICEGIVVIFNVPYSQETQRFNIPLPNSLNFHFHFPTFLRLYLFLLCLPGLYTMMSHMNYARYKKLIKSNIKKK